MIVSKFMKVAIIIAVLVLPISVNAAANTGDTSPNAMIKGGVSSWEDFKSKVSCKNNSKLRQEFAAHNADPCKVAARKVKNGVITKSGNVIVDGKVIATDAHTYGRTFLPGSTKVGPLYKRPASVSLESNQLPVMVYLDDGAFKFAVIKDCGNLVTAKAKPAPKKPEKVTVVQQVQPAPPPPPAPAPTPPPQALPETGTESSNTTGAAAGAAMLAGSTFLYQRSRRSLRVAQIFSTSRDSAKNARH